MLTKEELLDLDVPPLIKNVSLELYKEFSVDYLLPRKFAYHFSDGSKINIEFTEWGIYHMLSIQHINNRIKNNKFFREIDSGLSFDDFKADNAVKATHLHPKVRDSHMYVSLTSRFVLWGQRQGRIWQHTIITQMET